jgi:hypothetical protein
VAQESGFGSVTTSATQRIFTDALVNRDLCTVYGCPHDHTHLSGSKLEPAIQGSGPSNSRQRRRRSEEGRDAKDKSAHAKDHLNKINVW